MTREPIDDENSQSVYAEAASMPPQFERWVVSPIIFLWRLGAAGISLTLWGTIVMAIWLFLVLRLMAVLALRSAINVYRGAGVPDVARFEQVVTFWPRGILIILRTVLGQYEPAEPRPRHPLEAVQETLLALAFYTLLALSVELARSYAWIVLAAKSWVMSALAAIFSIGNPT
jgi:hypothetical protein